MAFGYVKGRALAALSEEMGKGKVDYSEHKRDEAAKGQLIGQIAGNVGQIGIDALTQYSSKQEKMVTDSGMLSETFKFGEEEFNIYQKDDNYGAFRPASQRVTTNTEFQEALKGNPAMQKAYYEHITKGGDGYLKHQERIASGMIDPIQGLNYDMGYAEQIETRNTQLASKYGNEVIKEDGTVDWKAVEVKKGENRQQEEQLKFDTEIKKMEDDFFGSELAKSISEMEASETITKSNLDDDYIKKLYEETDEQRKINEATVYVDSDQQAIEADPNASFENLQSKVRDSFVEQSEFDDLEYDMEIQENIKTKNENMARYGTNDPNEIAEIIKEQVVSEGWVLDDDPRLEGDDAAFFKAKHRHQRGKFVHNPEYRKLFNFRDKVEGEWEAAGGFDEYQAQQAEIESMKLEEIRKGGGSYPYVDLSKRDILRSGR